MENIDKTTLSEQVYRLLKNDIINQSIKCGEKLTIKGLQERFSLSSTPIREAMKRLGSEGLIDDVTNVGARVIVLTRNDVREIYDFCYFLDLEALSLSLAGLSQQEFIQTLVLCVKNQQLALEENDLNAFKVHSDDFHDTFFRFADNSRLYDASIRLRSQLSILTNKYQNLNISKSIVFVEHQNITNALQNGDYDLAKALLERHFENEKDYMMEQL